MKYLLVIALSSLLAACGSDQRAGGEGVANFRASCDVRVNRPAPELRRIALQLPWFPNGEHSYAYLGRALGIFAAHGFDVDVVNGRGSDIAARQLAAGNVDAAIVGGDALVLVSAEGGRVQSIGAVYRDTPVTIYSLREKGISSPEHLYGKRLGLLPGSNTVTQYEGFASRIRLDRQRIDEVSVNPQNAAQWILNGRGRTRAQVGDAYLDALVHYGQFEPLQTRITHGISNDQFNRINLSEHNVQIYGMLLAVHEGEFTPDQLTHLKQAIYDSFACARANPTQSINALAQANPAGGFAANGENRAYALAQLGEMIEMACRNRGGGCEQFLVQEDQFWAATFRTMRQSNMISQSPSLDAIRTRVTLFGNVQDR